MTRIGMNALERKLGYYLWWKRCKTLALDGLDMHGEDLQNSNKESRLDEG